MRNRIFIFLAALILVLIACVPTPEEEAVASKTSQEMIDIAISGNEEPIESMIKVPEGNHLKKEVETSRTELTISIDADFVLPETNDIPVVRIQRGKITAEMLEAVHRVICGGGEKVEVFPRAFYQKELDVLIQQRQSGDFDDLKYKSIEELDAAIASKTAQVAAAPEKAVTKPVSFSSNERMESFQFISNEKDQTVSDLFVDRENKLIYIRDMYEQTKLDRHIISGNPINHLLPMIEQGKIRLALPRIIEDDAKVIADQTIAELGLLNFSCVGSRVAPMYEMEMRESDELLQKDLPCAYEFLYTRQINSVSALFTNTILALDSADSQSYAPEWYYERIRVFVDDEGIYAFIWEGPYIENEVITPGAKLLPFEEILSRFERMVGYVYAKGESTYVKPEASIQVTQIRLGLVRVAQQGDITAAYLVPAWIFYGVIDVDDRMYENGYGYDGYESILTINAVDGNVIDLSKGY